MPVSDVGKRIKTLREEKNLSQSGLGKITKINPHHISKYENGVVEPTINNLKKLAVALSVTIDYLVFDGKRKEKIEDFDPVMKEQLLTISKMKKEDQKVINCLIDAFIKKSQMEDILKR